MDGNTTPEVMAKEVSALNTFWLIQYLTDRHPSLDLQGMLDRLAKMFPCYVENLQSGVVEPVRLYHLQNPRYWFSHNFVKAFHDLILEQVPDPRLGYKIGSTLHKTQPVIRTTLGMALLGGHRVAMKISQEAAKYNRTKEYQIRKLEKGFVEIRIVHNPGIVINEFTMQWNAGCFAAYAKLAGANDITVDAICVDSGPTHSDEDKRSIWDFQIRYQEPNLLIRLG
ncbi:hypothetical protein [Desulfopila aestuarii]|uniref:Uncharacterized protein n=1 Tax=Desulfopila aestuarii DSM 18488 TaxID=1121416 RepID=A0A1M7YAE0_9BACT|nr:hypothetical protein [Desulfopila aestuarii]SHO49580.1 hypothetical protein SAMN02745220_02915 [Desulfopila aestuarii DSM 18488]